MQNGCKWGRKVTRKALCTPDTQFCDVFKVPLEAHETKEKETKDHGSDASPKKVTRMTLFPAVWGVRKMVFVDSELCSAPRVGSNI